MAEGLRSWRDENPERSSGLFSLNARVVAKWTEDWVESVGDGGWEAASLEATKVREEVSTADGRRFAWGERRSRGGDGGGGSVTRESFEERSVVTIAGMFADGGGMRDRGEGERRRRRVKEIYTWC